MDLLKSHKRRSRLSESAYVALNISLAAALLVVVLAVQNPWPALGLVLLSKWRALAVRPRFWLANLVANMVDIVVGLSVVVLMYAAVGAVWVQVAMAVLYAIWLLFVKPRSRRSFVAAQAGVATFLGVTALSTVSFTWDSMFFVLAMLALGYIVTRHTLSSYEEPLISMYSMIGGVMFAEIGWIGYHWLFAYTLPGIGGIKISQLALIVTLFCFVAERSYASYHRHGKVRSSDILLPSLLAGSVAVILIVFFNSLTTAGSI